jgi:hypothetical protein
MNPNHIARFFTYALCNVLQCAAAPNCLAGLCVDELLSILKGY